MAAFAMLVTLGQLAAGDGGYISGGSLQLALNMANRFKSLGGDIRYNTKVEKIIVEDGEASGVILNGQEMHCGAVIVANDTISAVNKLFDEPLKDDWINQMKKNTKDRLMCDTFVCLGVEADLSALPYSVIYNLDTPFEFANTSLLAIGFYQYSSHPDYAPAGCTAMTAVLMGDTYDFWQAHKADGSYEAEKERLAKRIINLFTEKLPQIKDKVAVVDVAPLLPMNVIAEPIAAGL